MRSRKSSPGGSVLLLGLNPPSLACGLILTSQPLNPNLPRTKYVPSAQSRGPPRCVREIRAPTAWFSHFGLNPPTLAHRLIPTSWHLNPSLPRPKYVSSTQSRGPPRCVRESRASMAQMLFFSPKPPLLVPHPIATFQAFNPAYPTQNQSPLSIDDTPHAQFVQIEPLQLGFLFSLHFWSIAPIFTFSTIHQFVFAPVYILLHLHMYVHHQYTILGVQFRGVIS